MPRKTIIPDSWFEQGARATLAEDPWAHEKTPDRLRATNGPIEDIRKYWPAGNPTISHRRSPSRSYCCTANGTSMCQ